MQECFLTATTKDLVPVRAIDDISFRTGGDTVTIKVKRAFAEYVAGYIKQHPEQRV